MVSHRLPPLQSTSDLLGYYCYLTPEITDYINTLSACQKALELLSPLPDIEQELRRTSLLKSSLYSARIEGNPLTLSDVQPMTGKAETAQSALGQLWQGVAMETVKEKGHSPAEQLLPRRQEILAIIKDHHLVSFDFIARRFASVPKSSLHYDLKYLLNRGFVQKLGKTRGVLYAIIHS